MADSTVPRIEDYFDAQGRPKPAAPRPKRTLGQRTQRLIRDIPAAADSLNAFPGGALAAAPLKMGARGLARVAGNGARLVDGPAANPVLRGAYTPVPTVSPGVAGAQLGNYSAGMSVLNLGSRIGATQAGRNIQFEEGRGPQGLRRPTAEENKAAAMHAAQRRGQ